MSDRQKFADFYSRTTVTEWQKNNNRQKIYFLSISCPFVSLSSRFICVSVIVIRSFHLSQAASIVGFSFLVSRQLFCTDVSIAIVLRDIYWLSKILNSRWQFLASERNGLRAVNGAVVERDGRLNEVDGRR